MIEKIQYGTLQWLDITNPSEDDYRILLDDYQFHPLDIEDCRGTNQRPKIDEYDDYYFLILHFPYFDKDNKLVCVEGMSTAKGTELGIRDGCCFMYKNVIIERDGDNVKLNYADDNLGIAQKTAIGQRADGTVIMIVTDGRSAESVGATRNDMIDLMVEYGAVTAGSLDGGSSSMLYYRNYYDAYKIDKDGLEEYNQMGLVNRYKAFTKPRRIPTYFIVMPGEES